MAKIGFIGLGHMGGALAKAVAKERTHEVYLFDIDSAKVQMLAEECGGIQTSSVEELIVRSKIVVYCVKPEGMPTLIAETSPLLRAEQEKNRAKTICSIAAGVSLDRLDRSLRENGTNASFIRIMPNIPVSVNAGVLLFSRSNGVSDAQMGEVMEVFEQCGLCEEVREVLLDFACPLFSCSPAYVYMFIEAMAYAGVQIGLSYDQSVRYAAQSVKGAAIAVLKGDKNIGALKQELCTPGGMTIRGMNALHKYGFDHAVTQAILTAYDRQGNLS